MKQKQFTLRDYTPDDIPALFFVIKTAFAEHQGKINPPSSAHTKTIEEIKDELEETEALVVEINKKVVGCVFLHPQNDSLYIYRLSVLPAYRGQGLATVMMQAAEDRARKLKFACLLLSVRVALKQQQAYYKKLGFELDGYGTHNGFTEPTYIKMKKFLGEK